MVIARLPRSPTRPLAPGQLLPRTDSEARWAVSLPDASTCGCGLTLSWRVASRHSGFLQMTPTVPCRVPAVQRLGQP